MFNVKITYNICIERQSDSLIRVVKMLKEDKKNGIVFPEAVKYTGNIDVAIKTATKEKLKVSYVSVGDIRITY